MPQQRDRYDILKNILEIIYDTEPLHRNQMNKSRIGYDASLTHSQTVRYLKELIDLELIDRVDFKPFSFYVINNRGRRCLQLFGEMENDLQAGIIT
ncbi:MAG: winged helix-turn-helix domain-containing protein [Nitrososphaeraceae archaeon]